MFFNIFALKLLNLFLIKTLLWTNDSFFFTAEKICINIIHVHFKKNYSTCDVACANYLSLGEADILLDYSTNSIL
jgi:hypothetical protein